MKTAYRPLLAATFVLLLSLLACSKDSMNGTGEAYFDIPFELRIGRTVLFTKDSKELTISMISVIDSRCPINANCITAGNATIKLRLSDNSGSEVFTELCLGQCETSGSDVKQITLSNINYSITMRKVEPYPKLNDSQEKKVLFSVSKI
jgi:hypothetical protein